MLETCPRDMMESLAKAQGKKVHSVHLFDLPPFSLVHLLTTSKNVYLIETLPEPCHAGLRINVARIRLGRQTLTDFVRHSCIKTKHLEETHPLVYYSEGNPYTTSPIEAIHLLSS